MATLLQTALSLLCLTAASAAKPIHQTSSALDRRTSSSSLCRAAGETKTMWMPDTWNIYPQQPNFSQNTTTSGLEVEAFDGKSQLEQVVAFRGIPRDATSCTLGWSQADRTNRTFLVDGDSALVSVRPLSAMPKQPVTYGAVDELDDEEKDKELHPDFTFWDDSEGAAGHTAGGVDCAEDMYFRIALADPKVKSHVYLGSDEQNGLWLEYSC